MSTEYHLITQNGTSGTYWAGLTTEQKARYQNPDSSYRVASTMLQWIVNYLNSATYKDLTKHIYAEIPEAWTDTSGDNSLPAAAIGGYQAITISTKVNGEWGDGYHGGIKGSGYIWTPNVQYRKLLFTDNPFTTIEGFEIINRFAVTGGESNIYFNPRAVGGIVDRMFVKGGNNGIYVSSALVTTKQSVIEGAYTSGIYVSNTATGNKIHNCLVTGCGIGINEYSSTSAGPQTEYIGTVSIGNTLNWQTLTLGTSTRLTAYYCGGLSGEPYDTTSTAFVMATTDFNDYANGDYTPASSSSPQVNKIPMSVQIEDYDIGGLFRPDYESATYPTNLADAGPFEYDHGEGNTPPNYKNFTINGLISGSRVKIKKTSDGTSIYNAVVNATYLTISYNAGTADTPVTIDIRKGSAEPYYKPYRTTSSISYLADTSISVTQIEAIAADTYDAGIATDWAVNTGTKAITNAAGTTVYTLQGLYSWLLDYYDDESTVDLDMPLEGITSTQFELINSGSISDANMELLNGGSLWDGTTLWANLTVVGTLAADTTVYVHVDGSEYTGYWGTGNIDVSLKFENFDGTEVVDVRAHKYTDTYDHWSFDGLGEGLNYAALSTADDPNNQTASGTVAAYGITVTVDNPTDQQIDGADTPADYTTTVDGNGLGVQEVYEYLKYLTKEKSVYEAANAAYDEVKTAPYGTFAGGTFFGARGIWLENVASGDALNYVLTDNNGATHQASAPPVAIVVTNIVAGSRIQIYDLTNSTELDNDIVTGTSYSLTKTWSTDLDIRIRLMYQSTVTAYEFFESQGSFTATGMAMRAAQQLDAVYNTNAIDGSTITNVAINDGLLLVSVSTGAITWQQLYAYETYWLYTEEGIRDEGRFAVAQDPANYLWYDFKLKNTTSPSVPLVVTGGYGRDGDTGAALNMIDTSGGTIIFAPDHVVAYAAGAEATVAIVQSGLTAQGYSTARAGKLDNLDIAVSEAGGLTTDEHNKLMAVPTAAATSSAVVAALNATTIPVNTVSIKGQAINGVGTEENPWGP